MPKYFAFLTENELFDRKSTLEQTQKNLKCIISKFDFKESIRLLCYINIVLTFHQGDLKIHNYLESTFLDKHMKRALSNQRAQNPESLYVIFQSPSMMLLMRMFWAWGNKKNGTKPKNALTLFSKLFLFVNSLLPTSSVRYIEDDATPSEFLDSLMSQLLPIYDLTNPLNGREYVHELFRNHKLLEHFNSINSDYISSFEKEIGLSISDYQALSFLLCASFREFKPEEIFSKMKFHINHTTYLSNTTFHKVASDLLFKQLSGKYEEFATPLKEEFDQDSSSLIFKAFYERPLLQIDDNLTTCISPDFLYKQSGEGVFWKVFSANNKNATIFSVWGEAFQKYAEECVINYLQTQHSRCYTQISYSQPSGKIADFILIINNCAFIFEIKSGFLPLATKHSRDHKIIEDIIKAKFVNNKGIDQLISTIDFSFSLQHKDIHIMDSISNEKIDLSNIEEVYPILVVSEKALTFFRIDNFLNKEFTQKLNALKPEIQVNVNDFTVLHIEDIELLQRGTKNNPLFLKAMIDEYHSSNNPLNLSFHSFLTETQKSKIGNDEINRWSRDYVYSLEPKFKKTTE